MSGKKKMYTVYLGEGTRRMGQREARIRGLSFSSYLDWLICTSASEDNIELLTKRKLELQDEISAITSQMTLLQETVDYPTIVFERMKKGLNSEEPSPLAVLEGRVRSAIKDERTFLKLDTRQQREVIEMVAKRLYNEQKTI